MPRSILSLLACTSMISVSWGQSINSSDSSSIMTQVDRILRVFSNPSFSEFEELSAENIYCIMCVEGHASNDSMYMIERQHFFDKNLASIGQSDMFARATKKTDAVLIADNNQQSDISVFFTIHRKDEIASGHEGSQLGFSFKRTNGEFKFSGIDTVP